MGIGFQTIIPEMLHHELEVVVRSFNPRQLDASLPYRDQPRTPNSAGSMQTLAGTCVHRRANTTCRFLGAEQRAAPVSRIAEHGATVLLQSRDRR
jgi:hypothetical protein